MPNPTQAQERNLYNQLSRKQAKREAAAESRILAAIQRQISPVLAILRERGYTAAINSVSSISGDPIENVLRGLYRDYGVDSANDTYAYIQQYWGDEIRSEKAFGFNAIWAAIMNAFFQISGAKNVTRITDSNRERLRRELIQGQNDGIDNYTLSERLQGPQIWRARAKLIARTETGISSSYGAETGAKQSGILMNKKWLSARDKRTRRIPPDQTDHYMMNNIQVTMNDFFMVPSESGFNMMLRPHAEGAPANQVCNCRCKAIYIPARDARGRIIRTNSR